LSFENEGIEAPFVIVATSVNVAMVADCEIAEREYQNGQLHAELAAATAI
jgi:hypothetical protein